MDKSLGRDRDHLPFPDLDAVSAWPNDLSPLEMVNQEYAARKPEHGLIYMVVVIRNNRRYGVFKQGEKKKI